MNFDLDDSTDTSSIGHCCDAANEKYEKLFKLCHNIRDYNVCTAEPWIKIHNWLVKNEENQEFLRKDCKLQR
jgi:hypothetical protein